MLITTYKDKFLKITKLFNCPTVKTILYQFLQLFFPN